MAKDEHDREDLLKDATGYILRVELKLEDIEPVVFCGFRDTDAFSIYWGQDEVIQFNAHKAIRRGYWQGQMIASYLGQLHWLKRDPSQARTQLSRERFSPDEQERFLKLAQTRTAQMRSRLQSNAYALIGQVPADGDAVARILDWLLENQTAPFPLAKHPGAGRK